MPKSSTNFLTFLIGGDSQNNERDLDVYLFIAIIKFALSASSLIVANNALLRIMAAVKIQKFEFLNLALLKFIALFDMFLRLIDHRHKTWLSGTRFFLNKNAENLFRSLKDAEHFIMPCKCESDSRVEFYISVPRRNIVYVVLSTVGKV